MSLELRPVKRGTTEHRPGRGVAGLCDHRRGGVQPAWVGDGRPHANQRLSVGAASEVCKPKAPTKQGFLSGDGQGISSDFADVFPLGSGRVALILGDVHGKGQMAALCVSQVLSALRLILAEHTSPARALGRMNRYLCNTGLPAARPPVALTLAVLDVGAGEVACASAGAEPPLILRAGGSAEVVNASCVALGVDAKRIYRSVNFVLGAGDALLLATDGITGARRPGGHGSKDPLCCENLCYEGLVGLAQDAFRTGGPPGQMARAVLDGAGTFAGGAFQDDASVLVAIQQ